MSAKISEKVVWHFLDERNGNTTAPGHVSSVQNGTERRDGCFGGDGGDELFGGYERYFLSRIVGRYQNSIPTVGRRSLNFFMNILGKGSSAEMLSIPKEERIAGFMSLRANMLSQILKPEIFKPFYAKEYFSELFSQYSKNLVYFDFEKYLWILIARHGWLMIL